MKVGKAKRKKLYTSAMIVLLKYAVLKAVSELK
jgi:hypothetical protein